MTYAIREGAFEMEDGKLKQNCFRGSKALAQRLLAAKQIELEERAATGDVRSLIRIRFKALLDQHEAIWKGQKAASTILREAAYLRSKAEPFFGKRWVDEINRADVERWLMERVNKDGIGAATRSRLLNMMSAFFRQAVALGHARTNPCVGIRRQKEALKSVPYLDVAAQGRVVAATQGNLRTLVTLLLDTGLRLGEALRLRWADVDFDRQIVSVGRSKNYTTREVPFTSRGRAALAAAQKLAERRPDPQALVLPMSSLDPAGEPKLHSQYRREWLAARKRAGFPDLTLHGLRHVYAVTAVRAGVQLGELRELLGHKSLTMVLRYARHCPANTPALARRRLEGFLVEQPAQAEQDARQAANAS